MTHPILVTGAAGRVGGVGGLVVEALQRPVFLLRVVSRLVRPEFLVVIEIVAAKAKINARN